MSAERTDAHIPDLCCFAIRSCSIQNPNLSKGTVYTNSEDRKDRKGSKSSPTKLELQLQLEEKQRRSRVGNEGEATECVLKQGCWKYGK